jgi:hypothetical protein
MNTEILEKEVRNIKECTEKLKTLKSEPDKVNIQLRIYTEKCGWKNFDFNSTSIPNRNYVLRQLIMELENSIEKSEKIIKNETK